MATTRVAIAPMKVAQIPRAGADFQIVDREIPQPGPGQVRIKVQACGVCHSDCSPKKVCGRASNTLACRDTKSRALSVKWVPLYPSGRTDSAWVWAGTA